MKKTVRFFSLALAILLILPTLAALPIKVKATEPAIGYHKTYASASDGDLLYRADFRGTSGVWSPVEGWNGMTTSVASNGSSVTLTPKGTNKSCWGAALNTTAYPVRGKAYTVTFTLEGSDANQFVGFYPDWHHGFVFTPGQKKVSIGHDGNPTAVAGNTTYTGGGNGAQTYAVEFAVNNSYVCTTYKLYVKDGAQWKLILDESENDWMGWSSADYETVLRFFRSPTAANQTGTVTVRDLNVYKGLIAPSAVAYADAEDGDLLYHADFRGSYGVWEPEEGWNGMTAAASSDGSSVSLLPHGASKSCWGAELNTADYTAVGSSYTVTFTLNASDANQFIGFYPDWRTGFVITPGQKKVSVGQSENPIAVAGDVTYTFGTSGAQTYAIEIAVNNSYVCTTYKLYVRDGAQWKLVRELNETERNSMTWSDADPELVLRFFRSPMASGQTSGTMTVSDLNVYRGLIIPSAVAYADAANGDLLYRANFNGTAGVWSPSAGWNGMTTSVAPDGRSVSLRPQGANKSCWGAELNTTAYPVRGKTYTVTFTLEGSDANQFVGFYPDWHHGFVFTPGQKKVSIGHDGNPTAVAGNVTYTSETSGAQTYAIEFAVNNSYVCTTYKLYVKDGRQWKLILDESENDWMGWSSADYETVLRFFRSPTAANQTGTVTVSDLNVYKGRIVSSAVAYADAEDGDLLYHADFRGTNGVWAPGEGWNGMTTSVASNGSSVTLTPKGTNKSCWGAALNTTAYPVRGKAYTVTFTLEGSDANQFVGFYPDWHHGFVFTPGQKKVSIGHDGNPTAVAGNTTYTGGGNGAQTYAVEFAVNNSYVCTTYKLYVKDGAQWKLILDESENDWMGWSSADYETVLRFFRSPTAANQTGTVTVRDLNVYKGLIAPSAVAYADAEDGDLLYHADFRGTNGVWAPQSKWAGMSATVAPDDNSVTLKPNQILDGNMDRSAWGAELNTADYTAVGSSYTVTFTLNASNANQFVGFYPDWRTGFVITPGQKKVSVGQSENPIAVAGNMTYTGGGNGAQTYAVEIAVGNSKHGNYYVCTTYKLYVKDGAQWKLIRELNETERNSMTWSDGDPELVLRFFRSPTASGQTSGTVTVSDLNVYRGLIVPSSVAYADAGNRDLLYHADFRGTPGVWAPQSKWAGMSAAVSNDGSSVTLTPNQSLANIDRSAWGDALDPANYTAIGCSYTVTFTLNASDANQFVGFYPDWFTGFVFTPGQKKVSLGQWGDKNLFDGTGNVFYEGGGNGAQTYAVEFAVSDRKNGDYYVCTTYRLYVLDAGQWKPICELNANQRSKMQWSDADPEMVLRFFRSPTADGQSGTVTVSDLNVYRGFYARSAIRTATGAAASLGSPTGLCFTGHVEKDYLDDLIDTYGAGNVKVGMLITPTDYLTDNSLAFTKAALDDCNAISGEKYVKITATTISDDGDDYKFNCVLPNVQATNYSRRFSAITYVEIYESAYYYSHYDEALHARSIAYVAETALLDLSDTQTGEYQNAVDGKYSPYTAAQRTILSGFCRSVTVMSYNVEVYGHGGSGWDGRNPAKSMEIIQGVSPDILGLQEVNSNLDAYVSTLTSNGYARIQGDTSRSNWPELLYKTSRFTKLSSGYKRYSALQSTYPSVPKNGADPSRDGQGRLFTWAKLQDNTTGEIILAISTHLHYRKSGDASGATDENAALRRYEIRLMLAWIADQTGYDAVVIVGDMNDDYQGREGGRGRTTIETYLNAGYKNARDYAAVRGDIGGTLNGTGEYEVKRSLRQEYIYDYIFTGEGASVAYYSVVDQKIDNGGTSYPSDHLPIMASIVFD